MQMIPMFGTFVGAAKLESLDPTTISTALEYVSTLDEKTQKAAIMVLLL